jgi:hypothetical protein
MPKSMITRVAFALASVASLAACNSQRAGAEEAVRTSLKDPDSARFGEFYYNDKRRLACLTVNAKNALGGYTGDKEAMLSYADGKWMYGGVLESSHKDCRDVFADRAD